MFLNIGLIVEPIMAKEEAWDIGQEQGGLGQYQQISHTLQAHTSIWWHSWIELVGNPIHLMSFFSLDMIFMAIRTFRASYTRLRMFLWSIDCGIGNMAQAIIKTGMVPVQAYTMDSHRKSELCMYIHRKLGTR